MQQEVAESKFDKSLKASRAKMAQEHPDQELDAMYSSLLTVIEMLKQIPVPLLDVRIDDGRYFVRFIILRDWVGAVHQHEESIYTWHADGPFHGKSCSTFSRDRVNCMRENMIAIIAELPHITTMSLNPRNGLAIYTNEHGWVIGGSG